MEEEHMELCALAMGVHLRIWVEVLPSRPLKVFGNARSQKWVDMLHHLYGAADDCHIPSPFRGNGLTKSAMAWRRLGFDPGLSKCNN